MKCLVNSSWYNMKVRKSKNISNDPSYKKKKYYNYIRKNKINNLKYNKENSSV